MTGIMVPCLSWITLSEILFFIFLVVPEENIFSCPRLGLTEKWSNTLKQIVPNLPTICLSVFDHFMNLALKGLKLGVERNHRQQVADA